MSARIPSSKRSRGPDPSSSPRHAELFGDDWSRLGSLLARDHLLGERLTHVAASKFLGGDIELQSPTHSARMLGPPRVRFVVAWHRCLERVALQTCDGAAQDCVIVAAACAVLGECTGLALYEVITAGLGHSLGLRLMVPRDDDAERVRGWLESFPPGGRDRATRSLLGHDPSTAIQAFSQVEGLPEDLVDLLAGRATPFHADLAAQALELVRRPPNQAWLLAIRRQAEELGDVLRCPVDLARIGVGDTTAFSGGLRAEDLMIRGLLS